MSYLVIRGWAQSSSQIRQIDLQISLLPTSPPPAEVYALRKERNALLPVENLPSEVFIGILRDAVQTRPSPSLDLMKLSGISWWWWNVVTDCPSLWTTVTFDCPSVPIALKRSKATPVDIKIFTRGPVWLDGLDQFLEVVQPHSGRWGSFTFDGSRPHLLAIQRALAGSLPCLRKLTITAQSQGFLNTLPMDSPLTDLSLNSALPPQLATLVSGLRSLCLQDMQGLRVPTALHILALLERCPDLETLHLKSLNPTATEDGDAPSTPPSITLSSLRRLSLGDIPDDYAATLLRTLQAPSLTSCSLDLKARHDTELFQLLFPEDPDASLHLLLLLRKAANPVLHITVCHHKIRATFDSRPHHLTLIVRFPDLLSDVDSGLLSLRPYTSLATEIHLQLNGKLTNPSQLETMPNLTMLATISEPDTAKRIVEYLRPGSQILPCSKLKHLDFVGWWDEEAVSALVKSRRASGDELKVASWEANDPTGPGQGLLF